jgi:hypothetical protein
MIPALCKVMPCGLVEGNDVSPFLFETSAFNTESECSSYVSGFLYYTTVSYPKDNLHSDCRDTGIPIIVLCTSPLMDRSFLCQAQLIH